MKDKLLSEMMKEEIKQACIRVVKECQKNCTSIESVRIWEDFIKKVSKSYRIPIRYLKGE